MTAIDQAGRAVRMAVAAACVALAACVGASAGGGDETGRIIVQSGGGFGGSTATIVTSDDRLIVVTVAPGGSDQRQSERQGQPGVYARVLEILRREGPGVAAGLTTGKEICPDYGIDSVVTEPPRPDVPRIMAQCPDPVMTEFTARVLGAISLP